MNYQGEDGLRWYVIKTQPKQETRAECNVRAWGINTFHPKISERSANPFTGLMSYVIKPLFSRYIFAKFDVNSTYRRMCFTRGVHSVVNFGNGPVSVADEIIKLIQSRVGEDGLVKLDNELSQGDLVMIDSGPLRDMVGVFQHDIKGTDRVAILLTAISYQGRVLIEKDLVKKIV
ncbi:MAG TPA: transcription termination/antitermination NusG family protein [Pyrinomonadaceae bacterium]|jgi:transcriptional antiterminator RfaH|nr:transcription termination/antitermination NusG family protein [Pyrinomonadaceae bacterium]